MTTTPRTLRRTVLVALVAALGLSFNTAAWGQIPGITEPEPAARVTEAPDAEADLAGTEAWFLRTYQRFLGEGSPYRSLILTILTLVVLLRLKRYLGRRIEGTLKVRAFDPKNVQSFMSVWNGVWKYVIAVLVLMAMTGSLRLLGLTAGFFGMILGWSLQQPVTGIAAWLMILLKKPFRVGDRVVIAGITGDVTGITLTHVILNQVGGSVSGEERSGRGILIPNAILFQHIIINYTLDQEFMLDEVPVRLTFDSDWERAKVLLVECARKVTADIIARTGQDPFIRAEFLDWGVLIRLRYQTIPARRQEISTQVVEAILLSIRKEFPRIRFAMPSTNIRYRPDTDVPAFPVEANA